MARLEDLPLTHRLCHRRVIASEDDYEKSETAAKPECAISCRLPLGRPNDSALQHRAIGAALSLLEGAEELPILRNFVPD